MYPVPYFYLLLNSQNMAVTIISPIITKNNTLDKLQVFVPNKDVAYTEVTWLGKEKVKTVPEWISRIREQLSVSYACLGMKPASDYNRNVYLDILRYTRQDKELESRYLSLEQESRSLYRYISRLGKS